MPNWCSTSFVFRGPEEQIKELHKKALTEDGFSLLQTFLPCPKELKETASTTAWEEIPEQWAEWVADGTWTQEKYDERVAENAKLLEQQKSNLEKYGVKDWYEWEHKNWGVKWGDCETYMEEPAPYAFGDLWHVGGAFQTPWGTATPAWIQISEMFPNIMFEFEHDEEAGFFAGTELIINGEVVFDLMYEPCEYPKEVDWDNEDDIEEYDQWRSDKSEEIAEKATAVLVAYGFLAPKPTPKKATATTTGTTWWK